MEWIMLAFVVAIAVKTFEMARSVQAMERTLAAMTPAVPGEPVPNTTSPTVEAQLDSLRLQIQRLSDALDREAAMDAERGNFSHRELVDD